MKHKGVGLVLAVLALAILLPSAASAKMPPSYATLKLGGYFPQAGDLDDFDAGINGEVSFGHNVVRGFAIEGGVGYFETKGEFVVPGLANVSEKITVVPVTLSLKGIAPFGPFEPYGLAGLGVYFTEDKLSGNVLGTFGSDSETSTRLGFHVGIGGNFNVSRNAFLGVEARYLFLRINTFGVDTRLDGVTLTGNVGFRF